FAGGAPERVDAVILDGPRSFELAPADEDVPFEHLRTVARTRGMAAFRREWLRHPLTQLRTANPQMHAQLIAMIERFAGNEFTDSPLEPEVLPVPALPRSSNAPALVLSGELDVPRRIQSADRLSVQLPRAERAVITGAGHLPKLDQRAPLARPEELDQYDLILFGTPTRFGNMAAQMRNFLDQTGALWMSGALVGKVGSVFCSTASQHGGQETTITSFHSTLLHHGMIVVGLPYTFKELTTMREVTGGTP